MEAEPRVLHLGILVDVVDPLGVEERGTALDAVNFIAFVEQELGEVGSVLSGDSGDQCFFHAMFKNKLEACFAGGEGEEEILIGRGETVAEVDFGCPAGGLDS